jgi:hypothetical protein
MRLVGEVFQDHRQLIDQIVGRELAPVVVVVRKIPQCLGQLDTTGRVKLVSRVACRTITHRHQTVRETRARWFVVFQLEANARL